jgi:hypothetical protein
LGGQTYLEGVLVGADLRGSNHNDPTAKKLMADPAVKAALESATRSEMGRVREMIESALKTTDDRKLKGWVAVAVWEDENGHERETVLGDGHSTNIQQKGFLHSGVWVNAHVDA